MENTKINLNFDDDKPNDSYRKSFKKAFKQKPLKKKVQQKKKKSNKTPFSNSSVDAQTLINESNEKELTLDDAESLLNQVEEMIKKELPEIKPNIKIGEEKEVKLSNSPDSEIKLSDIYPDIKRCPQCNKKLKKTKVKLINNIYSQDIFCKKCNFKRELRFKI